MAWALPGTARTTSSRPGLLDLDGQVVQQLGQSLLAAGLQLVDARRKRVALDAAAAELDQAELRHVPGDRGLRRAEATFAERGGQLVLRADGMQQQQVPDGLLAQLLHDFHGGAIRAAVAASGPAGSPRR